MPSAVAQGGTASVPPYALTSSPEPAPPVAIAVPSAGPDSVAVCDQIAAIDKRRLKRRVGALSASDLREIETSLRLILVL